MLIWGPFLVSPKSFLAHFGWHSSPCIFKTKASQGTKFCSSFNFSPLYNKWKDQLYRMKQVGVLETAFRDRKVFGTLEKWGHWSRLAYVWQLSKSLWWVKKRKNSLTEARAAWFQPLKIDSPLYPLLYFKFPYLRGALLCLVGFCALSKTMQGHKGHTSTLNFTISFNIFDNFKSVMVVYQDNCDLNLVHQSFVNVGDLSIRTNNCEYMGSTTVLKAQTFLLLACGRHYVTSTQRTQTFTKRIGFKIKQENKSSGRLIFALVETKGNGSLESLLCSFCFRLLEKITPY